MTLVERLCAATGPSRELDAEIYASIAPKDCVIVDKGETWVVLPKFWKRLKEGPPCGLAIDDAPAFSASIDAAITLKPDDANCYGFDLTPKEVMAYVSRNSVASGHWVREGYHATSPAIAMCIAALRARESA